MWTYRTIQSLLCTHFLQSRHFFVHVARPDIIEQLAIVHNLAVQDMDKAAVQVNELLYIRGHLNSVHRHRIAVFILAKRRILSVITFIVLIVIVMFGGGGWALRRLVKVRKCTDIRRSIRSLQESICVLHWGKESSLLHEQPSLAVWHCAY